MKEQSTNYLAILSGSLTYECQAVSLPCSGIPQSLKVKDLVLYLTDREGNIITLPFTDNNFMITVQSPQEWSGIIELTPRQITIQAGYNEAGSRFCTLQVRVIPRDPYIAGQIITNLAVFQAGIHNFTLS
ncbi:MAG: hypothetical protein LUG98_03845 [Tannerellaceae bacterium]|nr:hypothetical protein [Tannerellaceae bacterium]